ncbi:YitT family protein [Pseudaestuariivita sp.]|uniref:YitT family protein n=1 Tax=Pseudaestuariivita sp. TaxID=2211669 RepID=UPI0040587909
MPANVPIHDPETVRHTWADDAQGLGVGLLMAATGVTILTHLGLMTGQTAGLAVLLTLVTDLSWGWAFFLVNLPFYVFTWLRLGKVFTLKSVLCVAVLAVLVDWLPLHLALAQVTMPVGAVLFGVICGIALLIIFRHGGSLGGLGVIGLMVQDRTGFRAGYVQFGIDAALFAVAAFLVPGTVLLWSLLGAAVLNGVIAFNHRRDRYIAR